MFSSLEMNGMRIRVYGVITMSSTCAERAHLNVACAPRRGLAFWAGPVGWPRWVGACDVPAYECF